MSDNYLAHGGGGAEQVPGTEPVPTMHCSGCRILIDTSAVVPFSRVRCPACGGENDVPAKFAHFLLLKRLGAGGMGTVFLAEDVSLGRKVAIKMMQKTLGDDPGALETFRNEAQSAAKLNHPHVAQIYSFGQHRGCPYLEMELVAGNKLDGMIADGVKLDPAFVMRVGLEIAEGLKAAEGVGLFHGDIKPDNILFDANMRAKLVDFGIASLASQGKSNELWGTPYYIAPEKVQKKKNSARSDIYSLGATLYHAVAGEPPYEGDDAVAVIKARFSGPPKPLEEIRPEVEPEVSRIIGRMMYNDLFMRYPNYGSLINDIKNYLAPLPAVRKQGPVLGPGIGRKTLAGTAPQLGDAAAAGGEAPARQGRRLVIQKGTLEAQQAAMAAMPSAPPTPRSGEKSAATLHPAPKSSINGAKVALYILGTVVLLCVVGSAAWFGSMVMKRSSASKSAKANAAQAAQIEQKYYALETELVACGGKMRLRDEEMTNAIAAVAALFQRATGEALAAPDLEPPPPAIPDPVLAEAVAAEAAPAASAAETNAPARRVKERDPAELALELKARGLLKQDGFDEPTREMVDLKMKLMKLEEAKASPAEPAAAAGSEPAPEAAPAAEAPAAEAPAAEAPAADVADEAPAAAVSLTPADKLRKLADSGVFAPAKAIRAAMRRCDDILALQPEAFAEMKPGMAPPQVEAALQARQQAYESRLKLIEEVNALVAQADASLKAIRRGHLVIEREAAKLIAERERLAQESAAAEAKARLESEQRQREARERAVAQEQVDRVRAVFLGKKAMIAKFEYDKVAAEMLRMQKELTAVDAQDELKWTLERLKRLSALHAFLIDDLRKNGFVRRAFRGFDIRGATPDGKELIVPMRKGVTVESLTRLDWINLLSFLLETRPHDRPIGTVEHGDQLFNAALFCYIHGDNHPTALAKARALAAMALEKKTSLKHDADKLLPILAEANAANAAAPANSDGAAQPDGAADAPIF